MIGHGRSFSQCGALARQAQIFALAPAVECLCLEPHFVCVYPGGNEPATVIADKGHFDHSTSDRLRSPDLSGAFVLRNASRYASSRADDLHASSKAEIAIKSRSIPSAASAH